MAVRRVAGEKGLPKAGPAARAPLTPECSMSPAPLALRTWRGAPYDRPAVPRAQAPGPDHLQERIAEVKSRAVRKSLSQTALYRTVMRSASRVSGAGFLAGGRRDGDGGVVPVGHGGAPSSKRKGRRVGPRGGRRPRGAVTTRSAVFPTPPQSRASSLWSPMALPEGGFVKNTTTHGSCRVRCVSVHAKSFRRSDVGWHCG